jgi:hypothetical protein
VQEIQHKVGCTCTSKSCHHLYLELPPWHCWSESDLKKSVDEWWPSMVAEDEEVKSWHKTIEPFEYQHLGWAHIPTSVGQRQLCHELHIDCMACARSKHIIYPACFENQNLTKTQGEYLIEKSSTRMNNKPARCTFTGFILAIDEKNSDTTCSPPWKQKE